MGEFQEFKARLHAGDPDLVLGNLVWYSVSGVRIPHAQMVTAVQGTKLGRALPKEPSDSDVFRRVCSAAERRKVATGRADVSENVLVRDPRSPDGKILRRIVVGKVDAKGRRLSYKQTHDVEFDKATSVITVTPLVTASPAAIEVANFIPTEFVAERGCLNSYAVREWIRSEIGSLGATCVRPSGGIYFVAAKHHDVLQELETFMANLPGRSEFTFFPLLDDRKEREMLRAAFEAESIGEVDALLTEITEISAAGKGISETRFDSLATKMEFLQTKTDEYSSLLEDALGDTRARLELFHLGMISLAKKVKPKKEAA